MLSQSVLSIAFAEPDDAAAVAALRLLEHLTRNHGRGHWSASATEAGVLRGIKASRVLVARRGFNLVGTVRLATKKPWAIDLSCFTVVPRAVYLHDLAVGPNYLDRRGGGDGIVIPELAALRMTCGRCGVGDERQADGGQRMARHTREGASLNAARAAP